ncbi:MAG: hypothetical protein IID45_00730, partial [Planctomycetes bacterium]|nr:hypothetical protein [Planctomycetota bacterium]
MSRSRCFVAACFYAVTGAFFVGDFASAQPAAQPKSSLDAIESKRPRLKDGFVIRLDAASSGKELTRQENLWMMEVT